MATDRGKIRPASGPAGLAMRGLAAAALVLGLLAAPALPCRADASSPPGDAQHGSAPRFVEQELDQLGSPFTRETVLRLNAIVSRSLSAIEDFDRARTEPASSGGAQGPAAPDRSRVLERYTELSRQAAQARADMSAAAREVRGSGERYNDAILTAMAHFVDDVDEEIGEELARLRPSAVRGGRAEGSIVQGGAGIARGGAEPVDITGAVFASRDARCASHAGWFTSSVLDLGRNLGFAGAVRVTADPGSCTLTSNSIPNHDFNQNGRFRHAVREVGATYSIDASPREARLLTPLSLRYDAGVLLNGVRLDPLAAACYGVGGGPLGREKIGCFREGTPWRYDPMYGSEGVVRGFGVDGNHAHTQPDGAYHYHGDPKALYDLSGKTASGVIGYAADGYPIFGPFIEDAGTVRRVRSGYTLKAGARVSQPGEGAFPGGTPDGRFVDDWEWTGAGDLDECNGMTVDGVYGYYVTDSYPWVLACFRGTPDASFRKGMGR